MDFYLMCSCFVLNLRMADNRIPTDHLAAIETAMSRMVRQMEAMSVEMRATRQIVAGMAALQDSDHVDVAQIKLRLARLERRLDDKK